MTSPLGPGLLIYGHRGARAHARDNTIDAFETAIAHGADGIELDVQATADARLIVYHDEVHPEAGVIAKVHRERLKDVDPQIPDFEEAIETIAGRCFMNIEIKNELRGPAFDRGRRIAAAIPGIVARHGIDESVLVSSFDALSIRRVKETAPHLLTGQLFTSSDPQRGIVWAARDGHDAANVPLAWVEDAAAVATIHDLGLRCVVWTVNAPEDVRRLAGDGVDVIITDDPASAREALASA